MKTKININGKEVEIELTSEQVEAIAKASKNEFEIDYDGDCCFLGIHIAWAYNKGTDKDRVNHGRYRKNIELTELSLRHNQQFNRLEELAMWLEPDWRADWKDFEQEKVIIGFDYVDKKFYHIAYFTSKSIGTVYMSRDTAIKICDALNNGELPELAEILKG